MAMKEFSIAILFFIYLRSNKIGHKKTALVRKRLLCFNSTYLNLSFLELESASS